MRVMEKSARNAIFKGFFQNSLLGTFESKQTLRQQIKKQTFPKATFQRILRILLGNEVYHTEDAYRIAKGGALDFLTFHFRIYDPVKIADPMGFWPKNKLGTRS